MKYVLFKADTGYCGCDVEQVVAYPDNDVPTEEELWQYAEEYGYNNADGCLSLCLNSNDPDEVDYYYENITFSYEFITEEEVKTQGYEVIYE